MKANRRHELQHNELADWLGKQLEAIKPYTNWILGGIIAVCAAVVVMQIINNTSSGKKSRGWDEFYAASSIADPEERAKALAKAEAGPAGLWAHLAEADLKLEEATAKFYSDKDAYKKAVEEAKTHYQKVSDSAGRQPILQQRALIGLAQAFETEGDFATAKEKYGEASKKDPESVFGKSASRQLKRLNAGDLKLVYDQLASYKPKLTSPGLDGGKPNPHPPGLDGGFGGLGGFGGGRNMPNFGEPLPERPDLSLPGSLDFPLDAPLSPEKPAEGDERPDETKKPADEGDKKPEDGDKKPEEGDNKPADPEKKPEGKEPSAEPEKKSAEPGENPAEPDKKSTEPESSSL